MLLTKIFSRLSSGESNPQNVEAKSSGGHDNTVSVNQLHETLRKIVESQPERIALESDRLKNKSKSELPHSDRESEGQRLKTGRKDVRHGCAALGEFGQVANARRYKRFHFTKAVARFRDLDLLIGANVAIMQEGTEKRPCHRVGGDMKRKECSAGNVNQKGGVSVRSMLLEKVESAHMESVHTSKGALSVSRGEFSPRDITKLNN